MGRFRPRRRHRIHEAIRLLGRIPDHQRPFHPAAHDDGPTRESPPDDTGRGPARGTHCRGRTQCFQRRQRPVGETGRRDAGVGEDRSGRGRAREARRQAEGEDFKRQGNARGVAVGIVEHSVLQDER